MKAIVFGAGNIGRGFIGQLLSESGYEVVFVEIMLPIVEALNKRNKYPVRVVSNAGHSETIVKNVRAINGLDIEAVADEIESANIIATAVGANALPKTAPTLAKGLQKRFEKNKLPINILLCENLIHVKTIYKNWVSKYIPSLFISRLDTDVGFVECSVGRMVPVMTDEMKKGDILRVWVEPYLELPLDATALVEPIPVIKNSALFSPFEYYIQRKLYIHNLGHAAFAYYGHLKKYDYIWQSAYDEQIFRAAHRAMNEAAKAISVHFNIPNDQLDLYIEDLLNRFRNKALGDTIARVGRDPLRKLSPNDRIVGALKICLNEEVSYDGILGVLCAALRFCNVDDEISAKMQQLINSEGVINFLTQWSKIPLEIAVKAESIIESGNI